jgi:hypothetical protein
MIFTSKSKNTNSNPPERKPIHLMNLFSTKNNHKSTIYTNVIQLTPSDRERMKWGAPTWTLFHCIPTKISQENFIKNKDSIIRL